MPIWVSTVTMLDPLNCAKMAIIRAKWGSNHQIVNFEAINAFEMLLLHIWIA